MSSFDQPNFQFLSRRSIIPLPPPSLKTRPAAKAALSFGFQQRMTTESDFGPQAEAVPDLPNVQGDSIYLFPKKAEDFVFFRITDVRNFKAALRSFQPSSAQDVVDFLKEIDTAKRIAQGRRIDLITKSFRQIAFTRMGMNYMGEKEATGDSRFDRHAMRDDKDLLGDQKDWDPVFDKPNPNSKDGSADNDDGALHGVITIAGSDPDTCAIASNDAIRLFGSSIDIIQTLKGRGRPGPWDGHEHFGYEDGVSQPALRNLCTAQPGQIQVDPGVIIIGYKGDPVFDDPNSIVKRPAWAKDGTMMVFRKLQQFVPEFDAYIKTHGKRWREFAPGGDANNLTDEEGAELFGARMMGRWKSGAPVQSCPVRDDAKVADDPARNNNFDYHIRDNASISPTALTDLYCPFTSHTRKTVPRNLDPYIQQQYLESGMIMRGGLPYGIEVTDEERAILKTSDDPEKERGLLFVSYQSSLDQGFVRQTITFAGNDFFPTTSLVPTYHGQDPIIGGPPIEFSASAETGVEFTNPNSTLPKSGEQVNWKLTSKTTGEEISVTGFAAVKAGNAVSAPGMPQEFFVTSHGGEYFFVPSIKTLKLWATDGRSAALDIMFVLDATASMQKYIDQVRTRIRSICDDIVKSGNWAPSDLRVGLTAFRDHPQPDYQGNVVDYEFVSKQFDFRSDFSVFAKDLATLQASGGGDGPEAQCDALDDALNASWKDEATKIVILITDSPPHGIKEYGDKFGNGCPNQNDPCNTAEIMRARGIVLHVLACEPTLSGSYSKAHDFYAGITKKTGGTMVALSDESSLATIVVGRVVESADIHRHAIENQDFIHSQAKQNASFDSISKAVYNKLSQANARLNTFTIEDIYQTNSAGAGNVNVWFNAKSIDEQTSSKIQPVSVIRIKQDYRKNGPKAGKAQAMSLEKKAVTQEQADFIVRAALVRH